MTEPTTAEIEAVLAAWDSGDGGYIVTRGHVDARDARRALTAALPLARERIAQKIAGDVLARIPHSDWCCAKGCVHPYHRVSPGCPGCNCFRSEVRAAFDDIARGD